MITNTLTVASILARLFSWFSGTAFVTPAPSQGVVPIPGSAQNETIEPVNDGPGSQFSPYVSGDWASPPESSFYGIRFQDLDFWTILLIGLNHKRAIGRID